MKKMKKLIAMLLAMVMVLGMAVTASANAGDDGKIGTRDDKGTITVSGIVVEDNLTVTAYQIVKATYDTNNNFSGYEAVYPNVEPAIDVTPDSNGKIQINLEHLNAIIAEEKVADTIYNMKRSGNGDYTAEVPVGSYLVVVSGAEAKVYSPMVVSVNYANREGSNVIDGGKVTTIQDGNAWVKETNQPNFTKIELDKSGNKDGETDYGNSVNVGSKVEYTLTIEPVPYYGGNHPVFNVVDTLDEGLTYDQGSLKVKAVNSENIENELDTNFYTLQSNGQKLTVDFVVEENYTLNELVATDPSCKIVITYAATLNENAKLATNETPYEENVNTATLNYTKDSKVEGSNVKGSIEEKTYTYSFDLNSLLTKTNEKGEIVEDLAGAKFGLYTDIECEDLYTNTLNSKADSTDSGFYFTDESGKLNIKGLEAGTYYLKEIAAPDGYSVNTHVFEIEISATYANNDPTGKDNGQLTNWTLKVDNQEVTVDDNNPNGFTIKNTKLSSLPSTGGIGTTIFTIGGCVIMIVAAGLFFASRRKENQ